MKQYININFEKDPNPDQLGSLRAIYQISKSSFGIKWILVLACFVLVIMFFPWTQNIRAKGTITTLRQEDRPQEINSVLPGKLLKWYVKEGDFVKKGDTILQLGEVKMEYFDPKLQSRMQDQILAKKESISAYRGKVGTAMQQTEALQSGLSLKLSSIDNKIGQQKLKIASDSADLIAAKNALNAYSRQISAARIMLDSGVISVLEFEKRRVIHQDGVAKVVSVTNKLNQSKQEFINLKIDKNSASQEYLDKIAKTQGERLSSVSDAAGTEAEVLKLQNQLSNYDVRRQLYFITAPQDGQITKAKKAGIGEILKEGEMIVEIVPQNIRQAVEMYVQPVDLPLVNIGQSVTFIFDGFPAIVFSGWPQSSFGTFVGVVTAVETSVSDNGMFRVLVKEGKSQRQWPKNLRVGGGANGIALLKDVPIYYEIWRNINGFPPEYYKPGNDKISKNSKTK
jgi:multidrug resistance efflux pump